jgi:diaminohydroxyphosphoribosylaminopyrimidine deaminase/5-amino-6-(5-phosphoribosylamino)uracil reductase
VLGSFVDARLADRAYVFLAPRLIGGRSAVSAVGGRGVSTVAEGLELTSCRLEQFGPDLLLAGDLGPWEWLGTETKA